MELLPPDPPLRDRTLRLEPLARHHLDGLEALGQDSLVQQFTLVPSPFGTAEAERWLGLYEQGWKEGTRAGFAIVDSAMGAFLGLAAFVHLGTEAREAEVGYIVSPAARGRGVAGRALRLLTDWGLGPLGLRRIELRADVANPASLRVAERCSYVREGTLRDVHFKAGRRCDLALYSRLRSDRTDV